MTKRTATTPIEYSDFVFHGRVGYLSKDILVDFPGYKVSCKVSGSVRKNDNEYDDLFIRVSHISPRDSHGFITITDKDREWLSHEIINYLYSTLL